MKYFVVAIAGKKFSGKTTVKNIITSFVNDNDIINKGDNKIYNTVIENVAFAKPIKDICEDIGIEHKSLYESHLKESPIIGNEIFNGITPRLIMQQIGSMFKDQLAKYIPISVSSKDIFPLIAIQNIKQKINQYESDDKMKNTNVIFIIDDLRFPNELELLKKSFGKNFMSIRIVNNFLNNEDTHESEIFINTLNCDCVIENHYDVNVKNRNMNNDMFLKLVDEVKKNCYDKFISFLI